MGFHIIQRGFKGTSPPAGVSPASAGVWTFNSQQTLSAFSGETNANSITVTAPSVVHQGDLLVCIIVAVDDTGGTTDVGQASFPAGWSIAYADKFDGFFKGTTRLTIGYTTAGATTSGVAVSWTVACKYNYYIGAFTPPSPTIAVDNSIDNVDLGQTTNHSTRTLSGLAANNDLLLVTFADCGGNNNYVLDSNVTPLFNNNQGNSNMGALIVGYVQLAGNSTVSYTMTSGSGSIANGVQVAFLG